LENASCRPAFAGVDGASRLDEQRKVPGDAEKYARPVIAGREDTVMDIDSSVVGMLVAALGGAAVGLEREWSGHAEGPRARFAGIRTITMLGGLGGVVGWLWNAGLGVPAVVLLGGAVAIVAAAYVAASRTDIDGTTEVAALVVVAAGVLAGTGAYRLATGIIAVVVVLLVEKSRVHALVRRIDDVGLRAGVRFGVMALVVLPLLPPGPYGPFGGIRPRALWALVLFFSGLSFLGYVARQIAGAFQGYLVTGILGGLLSSTNVTFTFARMSRGDEKAAGPLALGAVGANAALYPRVLIAAAVLNASVVPCLMPYLLPAALIATIVVLVGARRMPPTEAPGLADGNPLKLGAALQMAVLFQVVLMLVHLAGGIWGNPGLLGSAAVLGLTDVDALTVSMTSGLAGTIPPETAATAIAVGILSNTVLKLGVAAVFGCGRFRTVTGATLLSMIAAAAAALAMLAS
jgi:uncharacterized membrane protein (DUF4010 family)